MSDELPVDVRGSTSQEHRQTDRPTDRPTHRTHCTLNRWVIMGNRSTRSDWMTLIRRRMRSFPPGQSEQQICLSTMPEPHASTSIGMDRSLE